MTSYMSVDIPEETIEQSYLSPEIKSALKKHIEDNVFFRNLFVPNVGLQFVIGFKNRVGASILFLDYPSEDIKIEVAVLYFQEDYSKWETYPENGLTDKTGLSKDMTPVELDKLLAKIKEL